jgi:hypothetical protein
VATLVQQGQCLRERYAEQGSMRVALRHFLLDREGALYRLPSAGLDRMLQIPTRHRLPRLAGQRVRSAEVAVEMMNGRPLRVVRSVFNMLTFKSDGTLVPPLRDRHVRARVELALAPQGTGPPRRDCRSQYSVCRSRRSMDTASGCRATDRASRPGAPEMPPNITLRTWNRMFALLAR